MRSQNIQEAKQLLRSQVHETLKSLPDDVRKEKNRQLFSHVIKFPWWKHSCLLFAFCSMELETDMHPVIRQALTEGKMVALPRISGGNMHFHVLPPGTGGKKLYDQLELHPYGFYQPKSSLPVIQPSSHVPSLMLVPGLAFDREGNRLGRGKGYYDGYISRYEQKLKTLGVCFHEQVVDAVPCREGDKKIRALISDSGIAYQKT